MNILDKYLLKEFLRYWYGITTILILVLISDTLATILAKAIQGVIDSSVIFPLFITNVFQFSVSLIPLGLFLGVMLGMGRLYNESEMASAYACGLSPKRIIRPALVAGLIGFFLVSILAFWVSPWASKIERDIIDKQNSKQEIDKVEAGRFNLSKDNKTVVFTKNKTDSNLDSVFVETRSEKNEISSEFSKAANVEIPFNDNNKYFVFKDGVSYSQEEGKTNITSYKEHGVLLSKKAAVSNTIKMSAVSTKELWLSEGLQQKAELHWRIGVPISSIMLALLAIPLSHSAPRKGRYSKLVLAIFLYILYVNLLIFARKSIENGTIPVELGMWWVHALSFSAVFLLIWKRQVKG